MLTHDTSDTSRACCCQLVVVAVLCHCQALKCEGVGAGSSVLVLLTRRKESLESHVGLSSCPVITSHHRCAKDFTLPHRVLLESMRSPHGFHVDFPKKVAQFLTVQVESPWTPHGLHVDSTNPRGFHKDSS